MGGQLRGCDARGAGTELQEAVATLPTQGNQDIEAMPSNAG